MILQILKPLIASALLIWTGAWAVSTGFPVVWPFFVIWWAIIAANIATVLIMTDSEKFAKVTTVFTENAYKSKTNLTVAKYMPMMTGTINSVVLFVAGAPITGVGFLVSYFIYQQFFSDRMINIAYQAIREVEDEG